MTLRLLFVSTLIFLMGAKAITFQIKGISGPLLVNVQQRLNEFQKNNHQLVTPEILKNQIEQALYPYGYFNAQIQIQNKIIQIQLGAITRIQTLQFVIIGAGENNPIMQQTRHSFPLQPGTAFNSMTYENAKMNILNTAENEGYLHAIFEKSEVKIHPEKYTVDIILILNTGPRFYFGKVRFTQKNYLSDSFLNRFIPFQYGQPFSNEQLELLNQSLGSSGYFKAVNLQNKSDTEYVPIDVQLEPVDRINYTLGAGYGTDTGPRGRAGLHVTPVNEYGHQFNAIAQGSVSQNAFQTQYLIPGTDPVHDHYSINAGFTNLNYTSGSSNSVLGSVASLHALPTFQRQLSINALHERFTYTGQIRKEEQLFFPKGLVTFRKVSNELFSPNGYNLTINGLAGSKALLSSLNMAMGTIDGKIAYTFESIRTRIYAHGIQGALAIQNVYDLPLSLALLLGGAENMKGYSFNSMGPGKLLTYGGVEIQKETFSSWYLVGFLDAGNVYHPNPSNFLYDIGGGLMWRSPVGPIKIVVAQPTIPSHLFHGKGLRLVINMGPDL